MLVTLSQALALADRDQFAVGLFNTVNLEMAQGVLRAAEEAGSPVILGTAEVLLPFASLEELAPLLRSLGDRAKVPVVLHFDHGLTEEAIRRAIALGFTSVMYDCSTCPYEENAAKVRAMTAYAHARGVSVEAELGHVGSGADPDSEGGYTDPAEAAAFVQETQVDALAVAIGTAHGPYLRTPKLDFRRLEQLHAAVPVPLVLHGGSGLSDQDFRRCVQGGIRKINIFTDINQAAARAAAETWREGAGMTDLMPAIAQAVYAQTRKKIRLFRGEA